MVTNSFDVNPRLPNAVKALANFPEMPQLPRKGKVLIKVGQHSKWVWEEEEEEESARIEWLNQRASQFMDDSSWIR